jgi:DNA-binding transcriptional regulator YiaG
MRFKAAKKGEDTFIIDSSTRKIFGPFHKGAIMRSLARAHSVGHLQHKFTKQVQAKDLKLYSNEDYLNAMEEENANDYQLNFLFEENPLQGFVVRWARKRMGVSQGALAEKLGNSSYRTVQDWERAQRSCTGPARMALQGLLEDFESGPETGEGTAENPE